MKLSGFIERRSFLYHLTDQNNLGVILKNRIILSTKIIANKCLEKSKITEFLQTRRTNHITLSDGEIIYKIRDQNPISIEVLNRSLTVGWTSEKFIYLLNERVFWWPSLTRLVRHYNRYKHETPVIIKVASDELFKQNSDAQFCRLNSGATRCHPFYNGNAPTRGEGTFVLSNEFKTGPEDVAEVTFIDKCILPDTIWLANSPTGPWQENKAI
jgi:hypothetical protein